MVLRGKSRPARSSRWLSDSGICIIVDWITAGSSSKIRFSTAPNSMLGFEHRHHDQRVVTVVGAHALAQAAFLDEAFAAVERLRAQVAPFHVEPEAVRADDG